MKIIQKQCPMTFDTLPFLSPFVFAKNNPLPFRCKRFNKLVLSLIQQWLPFPFALSVGAPAQKSKGDTSKALYLRSSIRLRPLAGAYAQDERRKYNMRGKGRVI